MSKPERNSYLNGYHYDARFTVLAMIVIGVVGASFAFLVVGGRVLNPFDTSWLSGDPATSYLGWKFFRNEPHLSFPLGWSSSIGFPLGEPIAYLDSIPLVAMIFWPVRHILPPDFQYLGLYFALNCALQLYFGYRICNRVSGNNRLAGLIGGLVFMTAPPFVWRALGHFALTTHWLILAALDIFLAAKPQPSRSVTVWSVALCFLAGAINPYLTFMVLLILGAVHVRRLSRLKVNGGLVGVNVAHNAASFLTCAAAAAAALAVFGFLRPEGMDAYAGGGYGDYSMNLLAPIDPMAFAALVFKPQPTVGASQSEGYNYLGLGIILLAIVTVARRPSIVWKLFTRGALAMWLIFVVSLLLALSTKATLGSLVLYQIPVPRWLLNALSAFHASGRLFWPAYYLIVSGTIIAASDVFKGRMLVMTLTTAFLLQVCDLKSLYTAIHALWRTSSSSVFTDASAWDALGKYHRHLVVIPAWECEPNTTPGGLPGYWIFGKLAARQNLTINSFYAGRTTEKQRRYFCEGQLPDLKRSGLEQDTAYVFPGLAVIPPLRLGNHHCSARDGVILCATDRDEKNSRECASGVCAGLSPFDQTRPFEINIGTGGNGVLLVDDHWSVSEPWGRWTDAKEAELSFSVGTPRDLGVALSVKGLLSASAPRQSVWVEANRCRVGGTEFDLARGSGRQTISGAIPASCVDADGTIVLRINTDRARTPKEIGINDDTRQLGVAVDRIVIREANPVEH